MPKKKKSKCQYCGKLGILNEDFWGKCEVCVLSTYRSFPELHGGLRRDKTGLVDWEDRPLEKGVYGRDILQPYKDGEKNQKFADRYGDGIYTNKKSQLDGKGKERKEVALPNQVREI